MYLLIFIRFGLIILNFGIGQEVFSGKYNNGYEGIKDLPDSMKCNYAVCSLNKEDIISLGKYLTYK